MKRILLGVVLAALLSLMLAVPAVGKPAECTNLGIELCVKENTSSSGNTNRKETTELKNDAFTEKTKFHLHFKPR